MSIYRSTAGRDAIRAFAVDALDRWDVDHSRDHMASTLGPGPIVTAGDGDPLVLLADLLPRITDAPAVLVGHSLGAARRAAGRRRVPVPRGCC